MKFSFFLKNTIVRFCSLFNYKIKSKVIYYHDIHSHKKYTQMSTSINLFKIHLQVIKLLKFDIVKNISSDVGQLKIYFDDGFLGVYENFNFFLENKIPIEISITTSLIGKENYLNEQQILRLYQSGIVTFSSHSHNHLKLTNISSKDLKFELSKSKEILENILKNKIDVFCFPYGFFNKKIVNVCKLLGYKKIYSSLPGYYKINSLFKKRSLVQDASSQNLKAILLGGDHILFLWYLFKHYRK